MTQPARNIDSWLRTPCATAYYTSKHGWGQDTAASPAFAEYRRDIAPATTNHPMTKSGWREPGSWSHSGTFRGTLLPTIGYYQGSNPTDGDYWLVKKDGAGVPGTLYGLPSFPSKMEDGAVNAAILKLLGKNVNLGVAFFERRETAKLFSETAGKIARTVTTFRSNRPKDWANVVLGRSRGAGYGDIPKSWLEVQYGWNPLMADLKSACSVMDERNKDRPATATVTATRHEVMSDQWFKTAGQNANVGWLNSVSGEHKCKVRLDCALDNPLLATFAQLGLIDPLVIAWERLPYSFVIDWFLPIGDYLNAWNATLGWSLRAGSVTRVSKNTIKSLGGIFNKGLPNLLVYGSYPYFETNFSFNRRILTSLPMPPIPSFKDPATSGHIANGISLITSAFRK
jgi:hypothetical protein